MDHYFEVRMAAGNNAVGMEIFQITPVILGGSATDLSNMTFLDRRQHIEAVVYWNRVIQELRNNRTA